MRNIENVKVVQARELNALDLLNSKNLILTKDSINIIKKTFLK
jgi:ribosomal protein L4